MTTRTLKPDDPHAPQPRSGGGARRAFAVSAVIALVVGIVLLFAMPLAAESGADDDDLAFLGLPGFTLIAYAAIAGPVARWGGSGVLLTFGTLFIVAGLAALLTVQATEESVTTAFAGDNDGDQQTDEDDFGDADGSADDPTKVDGLCELQNHEDDDSDCQVDEDPAPVTTRHVEAAVGFAVARNLSVGAIVLGLVLAALFFMVQNTPPRHGNGGHSR